MLVAMTADEGRGFFSFVCLLAVAKLTLLQ